MTTISRIKPISYLEISNLDLTRYVLLYLDENCKLKRAIPDFEEVIVSKQDSLIDEALGADKIGIFKILPYKAAKRENEVIFMVNINDNGEITSYTNCYDNNTKLENFLLDREHRENVSKLLKKRR